MTTSLTFNSVRRPDGAAVLEAEGEIDMSNSAAFAAALDSALDGADGHLVVDLTGVEYLDSAGLSVLFARADRIHITATPLLAPVLTISGLTDMTTVRGLEAPAADDRRP
ncbi:hypothetical protein SUDANB95_02818 [Actinosynnema sp. ALI-1.44]